MSYRHGTAYGLDSQPDQTWRTHAACHYRPDRPDLWFGNSVAAELAAHICRKHCPVLAECLREATQNPPVACVQAGILWTANTTGRTSRKSDRTARDVPCGPFCGTTRRGTDPKPRRTLPKLAECGTSAGANRHRKRHEAVCKFCLESERDRDRERRQRRRDERFAWANNTTGGTP